MNPLPTSPNPSASKSKSGSKSLSPSLSPSNSHPPLRPLPSALCLLFAALCLPPSVPCLHAGLPEPDTVFYGSIALEGAFVTAADSNVVVELRLSEAGPAVASYRMGTETAIGDRYVLRAPMESARPLVNPAASVVGDTVWVAVRSGTSVRDRQSHAIAARGEFVNLNFGDVDTDGDGMSDSFELLHFGSITGGDPHADPDGDGRPNLREFLDGTDPLVPDGRHPADLNPADWAIDIREVTEYALAWKLGEPWAIEPIVIPVDYVTRASALWVSGEQYVFNNLPPTTPPLWWVSAPPPPGALHAPDLTPTASETSSDPDATPSESDLVRTQLFADAVDARTPDADGRTPRRTLHGPTLAQATRSLPGSFDLHRAFTVTLQVVPPPGTRAFAIEETPPPGWLVRFVNADGRLDARHSRIKWGPFYGAESRTLTYQLTPLSATAASFQGLASFDGSSRTLTGDLQLLPPGATPPPTLVARRTLEGVRLELRGPSQSEHTVETSADLVSWAPSHSVRTDASGRAEVLAPTTDGARFFRLRTAAP
ncbi:MAG: hypothetical protein KF833_00375 [Verrucomicrobiae bacterium]|nr:hypothetical protein [Verrucomicrobiae bacterium]